MMKRIKFTEKELDRIHAMYANGINPHSIAKEIGSDYTKVRLVVDPAFRNRRNRRAARYKKKNSDKSENPRFHQVLVRQRVEENFIPPPPDTRDLTAFLMGDPIPGRRAIDFIKSSCG